MILRSFRREDLAAHAATLGNPEVTRHLGGHPFGREDSWRRLMMAVGQWPLLGYGYWAVEERASGRMVGQVGFCDFERDMTPDISGFPEMGWIFDPCVHGRGVAAEAAGTALAWIDEALGKPRVPAIISPENAPSIRLAERLGFTRAPDGQYRDETIALFWRE